MYFSEFAVDDGEQFHKKGHRKTHAVVITIPTYTLIILIA
jgi:hypothetical protein